MFLENCSVYELSEYGKVRTPILELYPSGHIPTAEKPENGITALRNKLSAINTEFNQADKKTRELADAQRRHTAHRAELILFCFSYRLLLSQKYRRTA
jgi:hypothetical protein